jgi:NAD(P)-dependent dehydrogenase (short-subunit alcohol dehydrogenase family)
MTQSSLGRAAIVTGGGSGIGQATALALLGDGWRVAIAGRRAEALQETLAQATAIGAGAGERVLAVPTDVTDPASVQALFDQVLARWGRVDLLFNNAGVGLQGVPLEDIGVEQWRRVVDTNLNGMFYCLQQAFRVMKAQSPQGGRIINNGSISAHAPRPHSIANTATKHAVTVLTKAASLDGRRYGIAVGQIDVGNAATALAQRMTTGAMQANGDVVSEPTMDVREVGSSVLYMANLPASTNVLFHTVMATNMPFVGRG